MGYTNIPYLIFVLLTLYRVTYGILCMYVGAEQDKETDGSVSVNFAKIRVTVFFLSTAIRTTLSTFTVTELKMIMQPQLIYI